MNRFAVTLLALIVVGCGGGSGASASPGVQQVTKLNIGVVGGISDAAVYIANDKGWFKEQGIEIATTRFDSAAQMVAPLGTGQLDIGGGAPSAGLLNAIAKDVPLKIVADKGNLDPGHGYEAMMVRKDQVDKYKRPSDLKGKKVSISARNISPEVTLDVFLRTGGLTVKDVDVVTMAHADMGQALANGSIDMGAPIEPFVTQFAEKGLASIWHRNDEIFPRQQVAVILYGPNFVKDRPELAKKFMLAYLRAIRYYNDAFSKKDAAKKKDIVKILASNTAVKEQSLYDKMVMPGLDFNGHVNSDALEFQQNYYLANGSQKTRVDLAKAVDHSYVDWAAQKLGTA
jgi:NitT/TauT family transport system substrate-binding protein